MKRDPDREFRAGLHFAGLLVGLLALIATVAIVGNIR